MLLLSILTISCSHLNSDSNNAAAINKKVGQRKLASEGFKKTTAALSDETQEGVSVALEKSKQTILAISDTGEMFEKTQKSVDLQSTRDAFEALITEIKDSLISTFDISMEKIVSVAEPSKNFSDDISDNLSETTDKSLIKDLFVAYYRIPIFSTNDTKYYIKEYEEDYQRALRNNKNANPSSEKMNASIGQILPITKDTIFISTSALTIQVYDEKSRAQRVLDLIERNKTSKVMSKDLRKSVDHLMKKHDITEAQALAMLEELSNQIVNSQSNNEKYYYEAH